MNQLQTPRVLTDEEIKELPKCVMCGRPARFVAQETKEELCVYCNRNNNVCARDKRLRNSF